jgi:hypothetical protein
MGKRIIRSNAAMPTQTAVGKNQALPAILSINMINIKQRLSI